MQKKTLNYDNSDNSDLRTENKSQRNLLASDGTHSTNASSKINSDSFKKEPKLAIQVKQQAKQNSTLIKSTPKSSISNSSHQLFYSSQGKRTIRRPQKAQSTATLNHGQIMINRWMGLLKSKLPQFDLEDEKTARILTCNSTRR